MASRASDWEQQLPTPIPELAVTPDRMQLFMFSAVTWNRHRIHYDKDAALADGLPDVVVQRALIGNFFARMLTDWLGDSGEVYQLSWKVTRSALPDMALRCTGTVLAVEMAGSSRLARCDLHMLDQTGREIAAGHASLRLH
jgi:hydroxyacyl-ACP dehydratase HTD2-like protein with hotdog domain